jgi:hypothetical protein
MVFRGLPRACWEFFLKKNSCATSKFFLALLARELGRERRLSCPQWTPASWRRRVRAKCGASRGLGATSCQLATEPPQRLRRAPATSRSVGTRWWDAACGEQRMGTMRASTARLPYTSPRQTPTGWAPWPCAGAQSAGAASVISRAHRDSKLDGKTNRTGEWAGQVQRR